jgi:ABC-type amino acid transport system permease subunit
MYNKLTMTSLKKISKKITAVALSIFALGIYSHASAAPAEGGRSGTFPNPFGSNITNITGILNPLIDLIINIGGILVVFFIIFAGFKMVLAQGDPGKLTAAKQMLLWSVVGGMILLGSKVLAEVIRATVSQLNV